MKTRNVIITSVLILIASICSGADRQEKPGENPDHNRLTLLFPQELSKLANEWVLNYSNENPLAKITLQESAPGNITLDSPDQIVIAEGNQAIGINGWKMTVGREILVPVINSKNPYVLDLFKKGVTRDELEKLFTGEADMNWGTMLGSGEKDRIAFYMVRDQHLFSSLSEYLQLPVMEDKVKVLDNYDQLFSVVDKDPLAIAFCSFNTIYNENSGKIRDNLTLLPIDRNGNGKLDNIENIYTDAESFQRGVWIGKYPKELVKNIDLITYSKPQTASELSFLHWVLTAGQKNLPAFGLMDLVYSEAQSKIDRLETVTVITPPESAGISVPKLILFIIASVALLAIVIGAWSGFGKKDPAGEEKEFAASSAIFNERSVNFPGGLFYSKSHTWAFMEKDGSVKAGLDAFLPQLTGPITKIEMKKKGDKVIKGELFLSLIQKGKQLNIYAPVSGTILECNSSLQYNAAILSSSPYQDAWVYRIEPSGWLKEITLLSMADKYTRWIGEEFTRLKDFLANTAQAHKIEPALVTLQDGGEMKNNLLEELGPEIWEDFQVKFLDQNR